MPRPENSLDTLSPEFRLAVACCVWPPGPYRANRIDETLSLPLDWPLFTRVVKRHRIAGLAHHALTSAGAAVPESTRLALGAAAAKSARQSLAFTGETLRLTGLLAASGVRAACLKGAALSLLAFGNIGLRHSRDIDLLVAPEDAFIADRVLTGAGYRMTMPIGPHTDAQKRAWMRVRKHFEYVHPETQTPVELHWRLFDNLRLAENLAGKRSGTAPIDVTSWVEVPLGSMSLLTLPRRDLLLYLCIHGANHMWFRLKWIADVAALLAQEEPGDMENLHADAALAGASRAIAQTLHLRGILFENSLSSADASTSALVRSALHAMTAGDAATELEDIPFGTSGVAFARYRLRADWRFWLQEARSGLLDERDRERSRLPPYLSFLLPLLRVPFWVARRAAGLGRSNR